MRRFRRFGDEDRASALWGKCSGSRGSALLGKGGRGFAAAGNYGVSGQPSGIPFAPGNDPFVITVGANDIDGSIGTNDDEAAPWSAYGFTLDGFSKPEIGRYMIGPVPATSTLPLERPGQVRGLGYVELSDTSFAAPLERARVAAEDASWASASWASASWASASWAFRWASASWASASWASASWAFASWAFASYEDGADGDPVIGGETMTPEELAEAEAALGIADPPATTVP